MTRIGPARRRGPAVPVPFGTAPVGFGRSLGLAAITRAAFEGISPENLDAAGSGQPGARRRRGGTAGARGGHSRRVPWGDSNTEGGGSPQF